jgi:ankyrin repeat protein
MKARSAALLILVLSLPWSAWADSESWRQAVNHNDVRYLREHLDEIDDVDRPATRNKTALMAAVAGGDSSLARDLLRAGADPNATNTNGGSVLMYAAWRGDPECMRLILGQEVAIDQAAQNGWTALMMAAAKGHESAAAALLEAGADPKVVDVYGWNPLMRAAYAGREDVVRLLLEQPETDIETVNDRGQTALHLAVIGEHEEIATLLIEHGADPDRIDFLGNSAREIADELGLAGCGCDPQPSSPPRL